MFVISEGQIHELSGQQEKGFSIANPHCVEEGERVTVFAAGGNLILRTPRDEKTVPFEKSVECLLLLNENPLSLLIGSEDGRLWRLVGDDGTPERIPSFDALECRSTWHTPWGGPADVRSLAATPDGWVYADIHVGSIMRSPDGGETWEPVTPQLNEDVHQVATCPLAPNRVYANTARGVYISDDRGNSWSHRTEGIGARYGRAIAVSPADPDLILATVSNGPRGGDGRLYRTEDGGRTWTHIAEGFPASAEGNIDTHRVAFSSDGLAWAAVGKTLYVGRERAKVWASCWSAGSPIRMVSVRDSFLRRAQD